MWNSGSLISCESGGEVDGAFLIVIE